MCTGSEENLLECSHNEILQNNCDHSEDVGVVCDSKFVTLAAQPRGFINYNSSQLPALKTVSGYKTPMPSHRAPSLLMT